MPANNFNMNDLTTKMQTLQSQVEQLNGLQNQLAQPTPASAPVNQPSPQQTSTYPRTVRTDTVEDILNNPQWRKELQTEFADSELGKRASMQAEMLFMDFCEQATGKPSSMLTRMREEQRQNNPPLPRAPKNKPATNDKPAQAPEEAKG